MTTAELTIASALVAAGCVLAIVVDDLTGSTGQALGVAWWLLRQ